MKDHALFKGKIQGNSRNTLSKYVEGIQVCTNEEPRLLQRGDNKEIAKIH